MLFHTNRSTIKVCPPLITPEEAIREGIQAIADALSELVKWNDRQSELSTGD
jgi:4-aminobutyrate aminotransferase-like enzyme